MKSTMIAAIAGLAALSTPALAGGPNLLNNGGFEDALGFDFSNPANWNGFFGGPAGTFLQAFNDAPGTPVRTGAAALLTTIEGVAGVTDGFGSFTGHVQTVGGIVAGAEYDFSVWARGVGAVTNGAEFRIEWLGAGGEIARSNIEIQSDLTAEYQQFSNVSVAPAGATSAALVIAVQSFTNDGVLADISVAWDDASFSVVPTPGALAVAGLGGLLAARRRR